MPGPPSSALPTLPNWVRIAYATGSGGFQVSDRIVVGILLYFYLPPDGRDLVPQVSQDMFLGFLTLYGLAMLVGRVFDSLADPLVGHFSDRSHARIGRRRSFMLAGVVPMCAIPVLGFFPPGEPGSTLNFVWLTLVLGLYFVFFTVYVAPYLALMPEIARSQKARVELSTFWALAGVPVAIFGFAWPAALDWGRDAGLSSTEAIRWIVVIASSIGFLLCMVPILGVNERRYAAATASELPLREALSQTLANRPFRRYLAAQLLFICALNMVVPITPYVAVVMGRSEGFAAQLGGATFAFVFLGFGVARWLTNRLGPRNMLAGCVAGFGVAVSALALIKPDDLGGPHETWNLVVAFGSALLMGIPIAGFMVLPNVIIGQIIDYDERRTGANRSAMYFGMQGFLTKWMYGVAMAIVAFMFQSYGNSRAEPLGVLLVGPVAGVLCLGSAWMFTRYPEREVLAEADS